MNKINKLYDDIGAFAAKAFPDAGPVEHLLKLRTECGEAINEPGNIIEYADCLIALLGAANKQGFTLELLLRATERKLVINKARIWVRLPDGQYQHKDDAQPSLVTITNTVKHLHELQPGEVLVNDFMCMYTFESSNVRKIGSKEVFEMHFMSQESPQRAHTMTMNNNTNTPEIVCLHGLWYYKQFIDGLKPRCVNL